MQKVISSGLVSWFGGPDDTGVAPDEGLAFIYDTNDAPHLFLDEQPPGTSGLARRLDPDVSYIAMRWDYDQTPRDMLLSKMAMVRAPKTGKQELAYPADWGPHVDTGRVADLSPGLMTHLGITTDDEVEVSFPHDWRRKTMSETVKRMVLDISHHNTVTSWNDIVRAGIVGIIHKATEGTYMTDDEYEGRREAANEAGLKWGAYHFATNNPVVEQADLFLRFADPEQQDMIVLDWEPYGDNTMTKDQAREWIELVERRLDRPGEVVIYSGNLAKEELNDDDVFFGERRLWLAHYSSSPSVASPWSDYWLWQYSDGAAGPSPHGCPGVSGAVDTNSFQGTATELREQWASGVAQPIPEEPGAAVATIEMRISGNCKIEQETPSPGGSTFIKIIMLP